MAADLSNLTKNELKLYAYLKNHPTQIVYMSMRDIAQATALSTATLTRLIRKMGYNSFSEYKYSLKKDKQQTAGNTQDEIIQCLKRLEEDYYQENLEEMALLLKNMNVVIFHGIGSSGPIAAYGERKFSEAGMFAFSTSDPFFMNTKKIQKRADLFLSISGNTPEILELASRVVRDPNDESFSLAITANLESSLSALCDYTIAYPLPIKKDGFVVESSQIVAVAIIERLAAFLKSNDM